MDANRLPKKLAPLTGLLALGATLAGCVGDAPLRESTDAMGNVTGGEAGAANATDLDSACMGAGSTVMGVATVLIGGASGSSGASMGSGLVIECPRGSGMDATSRGA